MEEVLVYMANISPSHFQAQLKTAQTQPKIKLVVISKAFRTRTFWKK